MNVLWDSPTTYLPLINFLLVVASAVIARHKWTGLASAVAELQVWLSILGRSGSTGNGTPSGSAPTPPAGKAGGTGTLNLPAWSQLNDPLPDGSQDSQATADCGEECVAEVIYAVRGVILSAGALRFMLGGALRSGLTEALDLVRLLRMNHIQSTWRQLPWDRFVRMAEEATSTGRPVVVLGTWLGSPALHWVVVSTAEGGVLHFNDPWSGTRRKLAYVDAAPLYSGDSVELLDAAVYSE